MRYHTLIAHVLPVALLVGGCAHVATTPLMLGGGYDPDVITADQLNDIKAGSAYDLIRRIRPAFLSYRGPTTILGRASGMPTIYVDGMRYGSFSMLNQIPASWIAEVRLYRASTAGQFGVDNSGGVLAITTHKY